MSHLMIEKTWQAQLDSTYTYPERGRVYFTKYLAGGSECNEKRVQSDLRLLKNDNDSSKRSKNKIKKTIGAQCFNMVK